VIILKLSDLQEKDVVNIINGDNLGRIIDADINDNGLINYCIVEKKR
jgi:sporulation protein YlmC with PRC-barrel domain